MKHFNFICLVFTIYVKRVNIMPEIIYIFLIQKLVISIFYADYEIVGI